LKSAFNGRLIVAQEGIIEDTGSALQWEKTQNGKKTSWEEATNYVRQLNLGGYTNWRLPTAEELLGLIELAKQKGVKENFNEFFNNSGFNGWDDDFYGYYWTSSSTSYLNCGQGVNFGNGSTNSYQTASGKHYIRAVRNKAAACSSKKISNVIISCNHISPPGYWNAGKFSIGGVGKDTYGNKILNTGYLHITNDYSEEYISHIFIKELGANPAKVSCPAGTQSAGYWSVGDCEDAYGKKSTRYTYISLCIKKSSDRKIEDVKIAPATANMINYKKWGTFDRNALWVKEQ